MPIYIYYNNNLDGLVFNVLTAENEFFHIFDNSIFLLWLEAGVFITVADAESRKSNMHFSSFLPNTFSTCTVFFLNQMTRSHFDNCFSLLKHSDKDTDKGQMEKGCTLCEQRTINQAAVLSITFFQCQTSARTFFTESFQVLRKSNVPTFDAQSTYCICT